MRSLFLTLSIKDGYTLLSREEINKFNQEANFISRLYSRFISHIKITDVQRITIELVNPTEKIVFYPLSKLIKVSRIAKPFDFIKYASMSEGERDKAVLNLILNTMTEASLHFKWDEGSFKEAYLKVLDSEFRNEQTIVVDKPSPNKGYTASVIVEIGKIHCAVLLVIKGGNQTQKIELIKVKPWEEDFSIVKNIKWVDSNELIVSSVDEEINFKYSLTEQKVKIFFTPRIHDEQYLRDELTLLHPETSQTDYVQITNARMEKIRGKNS